MKKTISLFLLCISLILPCQLTSGAPNQDETIITLLTVNDFHGAIVASGKNPGLARLAAQIEHERQENPKGTLLLSAGDMFQGSLDSNITYGAFTMDLMNQEHFDAMVPGNHEFDWGLKILKDRVKQAHFPILCANLLDQTTGKNPDWIKPYAIVKKQGFTIAIIGLTTPETAEKTKPGALENLIVEKSEQTLTRIFPEIKEHKPDLIILLTHLDSEQNKSGQISGSAANLIAEKSDLGQAVLITGHSHQFVAGQVLDIPIVQAGSYGQALGQIKLTYDSETKKLLKREQRFIPIYQQGPESQSMKQTIDQTEIKLAPLKNQFLGQNRQTLTHQKQQLSPLGQWITDEMRSYGQSDIAFINGGGIRKSLEQGPITVGILYEVLPFDNEICTLDLTGQQIEEIMQQSLHSKAGRLQYSGLEMLVDPQGTLLSLTLKNGEPLKKNKLYHVTLPDFLAEGGDGFLQFKAGKNLKHTGLLLRDYLGQTIKAQKTLIYEPDVRLYTEEDAA